MSVFLWIKTMIACTKMKNSHMDTHEMNQSKQIWYMVDANACCLKKKKLTENFKTQTRIMMTTRQTQDARSLLQTLYASNSNSKFGNSKYKTLSNK